MHSDILLFFMEKLKIWWHWWILHMNSNIFPFWLSLLRFSCGKKGEKIVIFGASFCKLFVLHYCSKFYNYILYSSVFLDVWGFWGVLCFWQYFLSQKSKVSSYASQMKREIPSFDELFVRSATRGLVWRLSLCRAMLDCTRMRCWHSVFSQLLYVCG